MMYQIIDSKTKLPIDNKTYTSKQASAKCTKMDNVYGAYRYFKKPIINN